MTHDEAEVLRSRDEYWTLHLIYACRKDPRVIVRSRIPMGWTWNFGHRFVLPTLLAFILVAIGPTVLLWANGVRDALVLLAVTTVCVLVLIAIAHYIAAGPR